MTGEQLLIKTIKQCNAFEARVIELESDEYVNNLKADAVEEAFKSIVCANLDSEVELYIEELRK